MATAMLKIKGLQVNYGGIQAVKGIDLEVAQGELVTLIGANGAGKTTTMKASSSEIRRNKAAIQGGEQAEWPRLVRASATR
jgi:ABC-type branched-subunit amino acid transport system ATPase component